jgi:hypothetical protein
MRPRINPATVRIVWASISGMGKGYQVLTISQDLGCRRSAGDSVSMSWLGETTSAAPTSFWQGGYLIGTAIFATVLALLVFVQSRASRFNPGLYWATIIASTNAGTTMADFATRSLGIGYPGGSVLLLSAVLLSLFV